MSTSTTWEGLPLNERERIVRDMRRNLEEAVRQLQSVPFEKVGEQIPGDLGILFKEAAAFGDRMETELAKLRKS